MAITLYENLRAVFYAPFYAAHSLDAFEAEGVDVKLELSPSPTVTATSLIDGTVDVAWGGPMRIQHTYDQQPDCGLVAFCEVVTRDPFFLVGRRPRPDFAMADLMDQRVGTVSEVPTPWLCLQEDMRRAGLDPDGLERVSDRSMGENAAALREGSLDVMQAFQPFVEELVRDGAGHIWYAAANRGPTSYTTLYTTHARLAAQHDAMLAMTRALYRTEKWVHATDAATMASTIAGFFPDLDADVLTACIARYKDLGIWGRNPLLPEAGFERLRASCLSSGLVKRGVAYADCVDNSLARLAIEADPPAL